MRKSSELARLIQLEQREFEAGVLSFLFALLPTANDECFFETDLYMCKYVSPTGTRPTFVDNRLDKPETDPTNFRFLSSSVARFNRSEISLLSSKSSQ